MRRDSETLYEAFAANTSRSFREGQRFADAFPELRDGDEIDTKPVPST